MENAKVRHPAKAKRIGVAQIAPVLGNTAANLEKHIAAIDRARTEGVELLVFPELSYTGYRLKDTVPDLAVAKGGHQMAELAKLSEEISFVIGLVEEDARHNFYNSAFLFESGHVQAVHRKAYLPTYGMFDEQRYFARGRSLAAFNCKIGRAAILICEDMLHPTALTIAALDGASTIIVPSASPVKGVTGEENSAEVDANGRHWEMYNRSMARTLGLYIVHANRVGVEDGIAFWGGSEIVGPSGDTVAKAKYYDEDFISGQINEDTIRRRRTQAPVLRDENVDLTMNELSRIHGRQLADARPPQRRDGPPSRGGFRGDDRGRSGGGGRPGGDRGRPGGDRPRYGDDRGPRRDDRNGPPRDGRGPRRDDRRPRPDDRRREDGPPRRSASIETGRLGDALEDARRAKGAAVADSRTKRPVDMGGAVSDAVPAQTPAPKPAPAETTTPTPAPAAAAKSPEPPAAAKDDK